MKIISLIIVVLLSSCTFPGEPDCDAQPKWSACRSLHTRIDDLLFECSTLKKVRVGVGSLSTAEVFNEIENRTVKVTSDSSRYECRSFADHSEALKYLEK